ncbi:hypothetical protein A5792_03910 [Mycolicibacterium peregrinum]|uniref:Uncharacterized protein n=1 Tax=Mycolicibacterium peregrinum TaxID=43304 RepID=A0A1A0QVW9_MYCPR|nr:hypothetical protein A5792_03910 [Mycolicibacterium peregrinum]
MFAAYKGRQLEREQQMFIRTATSRTASAETVPEAGEGRRATSRVLHHPPMSQSVEYLGACTGPRRGALSNVVGADVPARGDRGCDVCQTWAMSCHT